MGRTFGDNRDGFLQARVYSMAVDFVLVHRDTLDFFPPTVLECLPQDHRHEHRRVVGPGGGAGVGRHQRGGVELIDRPHREPKGIMVYGHASGVSSSRKLAHATCDSIAFRYICATTRPDHRTIAGFRKCFLGELEALFAQALLTAQAMGLVERGAVNLDGIKIKADASKYKAPSGRHAKCLEEQIKGDDEELVRLAEQADNKPRPEQLDIPLELERREQRLAVITAAKEDTEARAIRGRAQEQSGHVRCPCRAHR